MVACKYLDYIQTFCEAFLLREMVFTTGIAFVFSGGRVDVFNFPEEVPDERVAADKVEAVSELQGGRSLIGCGPSDKESFKFTYKKKKKQRKTCE
jgi:hypothetical protein